MKYCRSVAVIIAGFVIASVLDHFYNLSPGALVFCGYVTGTIAGLVRKRK